MSRFTDALVVSPTGKTIRGRAELTLVTDLVFEVGHLGSGWEVHIPAGFTCDGLSAPWWAQRWLDVGTMQRSAILHDWLLSQTCYSKPICDAIFYEAMGAEKTPKRHKVLAWLGVMLKNTR